MLLAREDGEHDPPGRIGAVDGQVVVGDHVAKAVGDRLQDVGLVQGRQQPLIDLEQASLRVGAPGELARLRHEPRIARGVGHGLGRVPGEDRHRLEIVLAEAVEAQLAEHDHAEGAALVEHRHEQHGFGDVVGSDDRHAALVVEGVVDQQGLAVLRDPPGEPFADPDAKSLLGILEVAVEHFSGEGDRLAHPPIPVHAIDPDVMEVGQRGGLGDDRLGNGLDVRQAVEAC
jgi:hypothetical protein